MSSNLSIEEQNVETVFLGSTTEKSEDPSSEESMFLITANKNKRLLYKESLCLPDCEDICFKYVSMSTSSVLRHPYYKYPAVLDPGIKEALFEPDEEELYPEDGQKLYMKVCNEMNQCPIMSFYKGLLTDSINLKYYCCNPFGVRAMCAALKYNKHVVTLDLTDNFLNYDACYHLSEMLISNTTLKELILSGCKIGAAGVKLLCAGLPINKTLQLLNLNRNEIGDAGVEHLSRVVFQRLEIKKVYLSKNNITGKSLSILAESFETYNTFTHLDLSWNKLFAPVSGIISLMNRLSENKVLQEINLSWNSLTSGRVGIALKSIFRCPNIQHIDVSNNKFSGEAIEAIIGYLGKAKKLITLNLSNNPMTTDDALKVIQKMKLNTVKVKNIFMDNVFVNKEFLNVLNHVKGMASRQNTNITYGGVVDGFQAVGPDMRDLVLNRAEFLSKSKKRKVDFVLFAMQLLKDNFVVMSSKDFADVVSQAGLPLDSDLVEEIVNAFPGTKSTKSKTISVYLLVDYMQRKWPTRKLPPTPPAQENVEQTLE